MNFKNLIPWDMVDTVEGALAAPLSNLRQSLRGVTMQETSKEVIVTAEIPGLGKEDIEVDVAEERLIIRADLRSETKRGRHGRRSRTASYASFYRSMSLPCPVKPKEARALFEDGILRVELPKTRETQMHRVPVR